VTTEKNKNITKLPAVELPLKSHLITAKLQKVLEECPMIAARVVKRSIRAKQRGDNFDFVHIIKRMKNLAGVTLAQREEEGERIGDYGRLSAKRNR